MTDLLRIVLIGASILNCAFILKKIRTAQVRIEDSVFWILFSACLIVAALLPKLIRLGAALTGVQSETNFLFLLIIFILQTKVFRMSVRISQLESRLQSLTQTYAIDQLDHKKQSEHETCEEKP